MKTQGQGFNYKVNGENKTKEEIDNMDLSNMNCTVDGLSVSYSFPAKKDIKNREKLVQKCMDMIAKEHGWLFAYGDSVSFPKEKIRTKTDDVNGSILKGEKFPYDFIEDFTMSQKGSVISSDEDRESFLKSIPDSKKLPGGYIRGKIFSYKPKELEKDDVITSSSRGEEEMIAYLNKKEASPYNLYSNVDQANRLKNLAESLSNIRIEESQSTEKDYTLGIKETEGKLDYSEINFKLLDLMAKRFMDNKVKYPKGNSKKALNKNEILWAAFRHIRKMIDPIENDPETYEEHLAAVATNLSIILDQLNLEKSK